MAAEAASRGRTIRRPRNSCTADCRRVRKAKPMTTEEAVLTHSRLAVANLVAMLRTLNGSIAECDAGIAELFARHPDQAVFASFPGAGKAMGALARGGAYGTDSRPSICPARRTCSSLAASRLGREDKRQNEGDPNALGLSEVPAPDLS